MSEYRTMGECDADRADRLAAELTRYQKRAFVWWAVAVVAFGCSIMSTALMADTEADARRTISELRGKCSTVAALESVAHDALLRERANTDKALRQRDILANTVIRRQITLSDVQGTSKGPTDKISKIVLWDHGIKTETLLYLYDGDTWQIIGEQRTP